VIADVILFAGVALLLVCALGLLVMGDVYERLHYVSAASWGVLLVGIAILAEESFSLVGDKALAVGVLLVICGPVLVHATARAARIHRRGTWNGK
jgi:monovalent cation/proton antiporter MnhG/PhaG subunit